MSLRVTFLLCYTAKTASQLQPNQASKAALLASQSHDITLLRPVANVSLAYNLLSTLLHKSAALKLFDVVCNRGSVNVVSLCTFLLQCGKTTTEPS